MNVSEIIKQARGMSLQERRELITLLSDSILEEGQVSEIDPPLSSREIVRAKLMAAGKLSLTHDFLQERRLDDPPPLVLPSGARSSDDMLDDDRSGR